MNTSQSSIFEDHSGQLTWADVLKTEKEKDYFKKTLAFVESERATGKTIYPPNAEIFNALTLTPFSKVKVVILGQDPYHGPNQAHGLCFSVQKSVPAPPSLKNIYKELNADLGVEIPSHGNLEAWAKQGVLLLNTVLTVEAGNPQSHQNQGWEIFTDKVISELNAKRENLVFMLWGASARNKAAGVDPKKHKILTAPHPSPLSAHRGFLGCKHFSQANVYLTACGYQPIEWDLKS
ncbi:MAG: uracil-DNA glycosylase [Bdellovibrionota bacterium]